MNNNIIIVVILTLLLVLAVSGCVVEVNSKDKVRSLKSEIEPILREIYDGIKFENKRFFRKKFKG